MKKKTGKTLAKSRSTTLGPARKALGFDANPDPAFWKLAGEAFADWNSTQDEEAFRDL